MTPPFARAYEGDTWNRDSAYHQGTVWTWQLGAYAEAHYKVTGDKKAARRYCGRFRRQMTTLEFGSLAEIYDGDAPQHPNGCFAQAWSVAETLRVWKWLQSVKNARKGVFGRLRGVTFDAGTREYSRPAGLSAGAGQRADHLPSLVDYNLVPNIRRANIDVHTGGMLVLQLDGARADLEEGVAFLRRWHYRHGYRGAGSRGRFEGVKERGREGITPHHPLTLSQAFVIFLRVRSAADSRRP